MLQMLFRAVGLTATAGWVTDRIFEAGFEDSVDVAGMSVRTPVLGGFIAMAILCSFSVALAISASVESKDDKVRLRCISKLASCAGILTLSLD